MGRACPQPPSLGADSTEEQDEGGGAELPNLSSLPREALWKIFLAEFKASIHSSVWHEAQDEGMLGRPQPHTPALTLAAPTSQGPLLAGLPMLSHHPIAPTLFPLGNPGIQLLSCGADGYLRGSGLLNQTFKSHNPWWEADKGAVAES